MVQKGTLFERSEFRFYPIFSNNNRGFRNSVVTFLGLPFVRSKKVHAAGAAWVSVAAPIACETVFASKRTLPHYREAGATLPQVPR
jgi:hypothetical protein